MVDILNDGVRPICKDSGISGLDSGIDSQSLSAGKSEGEALFP